MTLDMTRGKPLPLLLRFALPLMFLSVQQQLYTVCDSIIVGRLLGTEAFAAVGAAAYLHWFPVSMLQGCAQGFGIALAQRFGAKDSSGLRSRFAGSFLLLLVIGLLFSLSGLFFLRPLLGLMDTPRELVGDCAAYLTTLWIALPVTAALNALTSSLLAVGDSKTPFYSMLVSSLMNIALDFLLIAALRTGVTGAALATVLSQAAAALFCLRFVRRAGLFPGKREWLPQKSTVRELLKLGLPLLFSNGVTATGGGFFQAAVNRCGVTFVAGMAASHRYYEVLNVVGYGMEGAAGAFAGQNAGAGDRYRMAQGVRTSILVCVAASAVIVAAVIPVARWLIRLYVPDAAADTLLVGAESLRVEAAFLISLNLLCLYRASIQGMGNTVIPMASGFLELILRLLAVGIFPALWGRSGLYFIDAAAWVPTALFLCCSYYILRCRYFPKR